MSELEKTQLGKSWRRPRTTSRSSRPTIPQLERLYSGQHLDDQSYYHHDDHEYSDDTDSLNASATVRLEEDTSENRKAERIREEAGDSRDSIPDDRDLELQGPPLGKRSTTRSVKPEYLVRRMFALRLCFKLIVGDR